MKPLLAQKNMSFSRTEYTFCIYFILCHLAREAICLRTEYRHKALTGWLTGK
jgi:hypothetical protein